MAVYVYTTLCMCASEQEYDIVCVCDIHLTHDMYYMYNHTGRLFTFCISCNF